MDTFSAHNEESVTAASDSVEDVSESESGQQQQEQGDSSVTQLSSKQSESSSTTDNMLPANEVYTRDNKDKFDAVEDPYKKATEYLAHRQIFQLFQNLTTDIVYKKPDEPIKMMIDELRNLQRQDRHNKGVTES